MQDLSILDHQYDPSRLINPNMQHLLDEIADVRMGLTLRGVDASKRTVEGGPHYLRISDLTIGRIGLGVPNTNFPDQR